MTVSTIVGATRKIMQFGNFVFVEAQEITLQGNLQGSKCGNKGFTFLFTLLIL